VGADGFIVAQSCRDGKEMPRGSSSLEWLPLSLGSPPARQSLAPALWRTPHWCCHVLSALLCRDERPSRRWRVRLWAATAGSGHGQRGHAPWSCRFVLMLLAFLCWLFSTRAFLRNKLRRCRAPQHQTRSWLAKNPWPRPFPATSCEARSLRFSFRGFSFFDF